MRISDWSSDVCSSDLGGRGGRDGGGGRRGRQLRKIGQHRAVLSDEQVEQAGQEAGHLGSGDGLVGEVAPGAGAGGDAHLGGLGDAGGRSEEHTSELQSLMRISYAVFCLKKKLQAELQTCCVK